MTQTIFKTPDAVTGTTTVKNRGSQLFGNVEAESVSFGKSETFGEALKKLADACIIATKESKAPYAYTNMVWDGVTYGISVSLRYNKGVVKAFTMFCCDEQKNDEFMLGASMYITNYLEQRGINKSKPFMKIVKRNGGDLDQIKALTDYMFEHSSVKFNN